MRGAWNGKLTAEGVDDDTEDDVEEDDDHEEEEAKVEYDTPGCLPVVPCWGLHQFAHPCAVPQSVCFKFD